jgi:glycosyltransferase A (GT-A) superfamily protein (DUF2064 family)
VNAPVALVMAKVPVPGRVKTRLGAHVGAQRAAELAAAARLDTLATCMAAYGDGRCHLALDGDLAHGVLADDLRDAVAGWTVHPQHGPGFAARLARAHADVAAAAGAPVVQVGMDTPQLAAGHLLEAAALLTDQDSTVLAPAYDGGWWLLAVPHPAYAADLVHVTMSTDRTYAATRRVLEARGARVHALPRLRDVDTAADADAVADAAPHTRFARAWRAEVPA